MQKPRRQFVFMLVATLLLTAAASTAEAAWFRTTWQPVQSSKMQSQPTSSVPYRSRTTIRNGNSSRSSSWSHSHPKWRADRKVTGAAYGR